MCPGQKVGKTSIRIKPGQFRLVYLVHDVARLRRTVVDKALKPLGITRSQWWVRANLSRFSDEGMMQTELANAMDIGKVALGGMPDKFEANGHVVRTPDPADRRAKRLTLTDSGVKLLTAVELRAAALNRVMIRGVAIENVLVTEETLLLLLLKTRLIDMDRNVETGGDADDAEPGRDY